MQMKQILLLLIGLSITLLFSGCTQKEVIIQKPQRPNIQEANIIQCRNTDILENTKCILNNYIEVKQERDSYKSWAIQITQ